ncbi:MAG: hypothetical protein ACE5Z5_02900 [Candidatus Bathyarchaeia archaeon]
MVLERVLRGTPTGTIFSYLPEIFRSIGLEVKRQKVWGYGERFNGLIEGVKPGKHPILVRVRVEGGEEPWSRIGGNFIRLMFTTHMTAEAYDVAGENREESMRLLQQLDSKISMYVWHTSG